MTALSSILPPRPIMPFIDDKTASALEVEGLLSPAFDNKRQLSTKVFALSSGAMPPSKYHRMSAGITTFAEASSVSQHVETITIPDRMGPDVFEFMGLTKARAKTVWDAAHHRPDPEKISIPEFGLLHINNRDDIDDWSLHYLSYGINKELCDAILNPKFADLRGTANAKFWLREVFHARFHFLSYLGERARVALARLHGKGLEEVHPNNGDGDDESTVGDLPDMPTYPACSFSATRHMVGYKVLWRAGYKFKTLSLVDKTTGAFLPKKVASEGDSGRSKAFYMTPDKAVADRYAAFYKFLSPHCEVVIARVVIPDDRLAKLNVARQTGDFDHDDPEPSRDWGEVVVAARSRSRAPMRSPSSFPEAGGTQEQRVFDVFDVFEGPILNAPTGPGSFEKPSWRDVLLHVDNGSDGVLRAVQWCFFSKSAYEVLTGLSAGLVTFYNVGASAHPKDRREVVVQRDDGWCVSVRALDLGLDRFKKVQFKATCGAWEFR